MRTDNVGIGTASPGYKLDVNGQARLGGTAGLFVGIGTAFSAGQAEAYTTSTTPMGIGTVGAAPLRFYTNSNFNAVLDSSGNLGIGVTSESVRYLNVEKSSPSASVDILAKNTGAAWTSVICVSEFFSGASGGDQIISRHYDGT
jgi:hypothetical protein